MVSKQLRGEAPLCERERADGGRWRGMFLVDKAERGGFYSGTLLHARISEIGAMADDETGNNLRRKNDSSLSYARP